MNKDAKLGMPLGRLSQTKQRREPTAAEITYNVHGFMQAGSEPKPNQGTKADSDKYNSQLLVYGNIYNWIFNSVILLFANEVYRNYFTARCVFITNIPGTSVVLPFIFIQLLALFCCFQLF